MGDSTASPNPSASTELHGAAAIAWSAAQRDVYELGSMPKDIQLFCIAKGHDTCIGWTTNELWMFGEVTTQWNEAGIVSDDIIAVWTLHKRKLLRAAQKGDRQLLDKITTVLGAV